MKDAIQKNSSAPIRRANDYDIDFFAPVSKTTVESEESYGFHDNSDFAFNHDPDESFTSVPVEEDYDDDVASFRSRYRRPLTRSRKELPPTISGYSDDEFAYQRNYNWFEDDNLQSKNKDAYNKELEGGSIVKTSSRIIHKEQPSSPIRKSSNTDNVDRGTIVRKTAKILRPNTPHSSVIADNTPRVVKTSARILPKRESEEGDSMLPSQLSRPRNLVPSFMEPQKTKALISNANAVSGQRLTPNMTEASNGYSSTSYSTTLLHQMEHLTAQIYQLNDGVEFNIDSPKQVSRFLFGEEGKSSNKDALEALASTGNQMATCIYKYRKVAREYKRELKKIELMEKGERKNDYYGNLARRRDGEAVESSTRTTENSNQRREPLLLIDTSAYIFRSYHAIPPLHHSDGTPTGALHGVCRMLQNLLLNRLLKGEQPRVVLVFDSKGDNFRHQLYPEYKANRGPCPEDLIPQFELVREAADAFGIVQVQAEGYEADDVIATLARRAVEEGVDVDILSGDKDLMQLITPS
jgi:hypothetical protein